jgi:hypothetical protein
LTSSIYPLDDTSTTAGTVHRGAVRHWQFGDLVALKTGREAWQRKAAAMSAGVPIIALSALVALSLVARQRDYAMTSTSLMFLTGALAVWMLASYSIFG